QVPWPRLAPTPTPSRLQVVAKPKGWDRGPDSPLPRHHAPRHAHFANDDAGARLSARLTRVTSEQARSHATPTGAHGRCEMTKGGSKKMRAYVLIETAPGKTKAVKKELAAIQGTDSTVANLDAVTGPFDFIAVVEGPTLDAVGRLVTDEIGSIDGVTRTTTC